MVPVSRDCLWKSCALRPYGVQIFSSLLTYSCCIGLACSVRFQPLAATAPAVLYVLKITHVDRMLFSLSMNDKRHDGQTTFRRVCALIQDSSTHAHTRKHTHICTCAPIAAITSEWGPSPNCVPSALPLSQSVPSLFPVSLPPVTSPFGTPHLSKSQISSFLFDFGCLRRHKRTQRTDKT